MPKLRSKFIYDNYNFGNGKQTPTTPYKDGGVDGGASGSSPNQVCQVQQACTTTLEF
jgi:hypothetical protein